MKTHTGLRSGMAVFTFVWLGQLISVIGSGLTNFALGIWIFQKSGSTTQFAFISVFGVLPPLLVAPIAGTLVDRWNRRYIMLAADIAGALTSGMLALLLVLGKLNFPLVCAGVLTYSMIGTFQRPAYSAAIPMLLSNEKLGRANGLVQLAGAAGQLISPIAAGFLMSVVRIQSILFLDVVTFVCAAAVLLAVRFPPLPALPAGETRPPSLVKEFVEGWKYLFERSGLLALVGFTAAVNFCIALASVLFTPVVLSFASPAAMGTIASVGGVGMLAGSILMSAWGGPKRRAAGVVAFSMCTGACIALSGLRPSWILFAAVAFCAFLTVALTNACSQAVFQSHVDSRFQGRIFATLQLVYGAVAPVAFLAAGPLADRIFEPLLRTGGPLAVVVGSVIGVGRGRGTGLLLIVIGFAIVAISIVALFNRPIRSLDEEQPVLLATSIEPQALEADA